MGNESFSDLTAKFHRFLLDDPETREYYLELLRNPMLVGLSERELSGLPPEPRTGRILAGYFSRVAAQASRLSHDLAGPAPPAAGDYQNESYRRHKAHLDRYVVEEHRVRHAQHWLREDTVSAWCYRRMLSPVDPLLECRKGLEWLTVGDGMFGFEAHHVEKHGSRALATDISVEMLRQAVERSFIRECRAENAERLSFPDGSFDCVLCKEAVHHFPRPPVAIYEMIRVARFAVALVEPRDHGVDGYEDSGNYIYGLDERELVKMALGLDLPAVSFAPLNNYYAEGSEYVAAEAGSPIFEKTQREIEERDRNCREGRTRSEMLVAILFKKAPDAALAAALERKGHSVRVLQRNPYVDAPLPQGIYNAP